MAELPPPLGTPESNQSSARERPVHLQIVQTLPAQEVLPKAAEKIVAAPIELQATRSRRRSRWRRQSVWLYYGGIGILAVLTGVAAAYFTLDLDTRQSQGPVNLVVRTPALKPAADAMHTAGTDERLEPQARPAAPETRASGNNAPPADAATEPEGTAEAIELPQPVAAPPLMLAAANAPAANGPPSESLAIPAAYTAAAGAGELNANDRTEQSAEPARNETQAPAASAGDVTAATGSPPPLPAQRPQATEPPRTAAATLEGYVVQLLATRNRSGAEREATRLRKRYDDLLSDMPLDVQSVALNNNSVMFRVVTAPLENRTQARQLCSAFRARKQDCLVVRRTADGA